MDYDKSMKVVLDGLKLVGIYSDIYLHRTEVLSALEEPRFEQSSDRNFVEEFWKKKKIRRFILQIKAISNLTHGLNLNNDFAIHESLKLFKLTVRTHILVLSDPDCKFLSPRTKDLLKQLLAYFGCDSHLPGSVLQIIIKVINEEEFWNIKEECFNIFLMIWEMCNNDSWYIMYVIENLLADLQMSIESLGSLGCILRMKKLNSRNVLAKLILERCCHLLVECNYMKKSDKISVEDCLYHLVSNDTKYLPELACLSVRTSYGPYRSDIADFLYYHCKNMDISGMVSLISPLMLMLEDQDPDVVIRGYQIFIQIINRPIACLYQLQKDQFCSIASMITRKSQACQLNIINAIKREIKRLILTMLLGYIRHSIYPKTLEAILIFNCLLIVDVKDPDLLPQITNFLLNLQDSSLSILPLSTIRHSFMQWVVTHLFFLVADVYSISSLKDYVSVVLNHRKKLTPFLCFPLSTSYLDSIPPSCLMDKHQVKSIIENWSQLVEPTRTLHQVSSSSSLSVVSDWSDLDFEL